MKSSLETVSEFENVSADTDEISKKTRNQFAHSLLFNHQLFENIGINAKVRKDFNTDYKIPLVYALGTEIKTSHTTFVRINGSKNYKVPSFNDLYWPALGNKNLIPESSLQADAGMVYKSNNFKFDIGGYYINTKDKIVWTPGGDPNRPGVWVPVNIDEVFNKGLEIVIAYKINLLKHTFTIQSNYNYTISKNKRTNEFVPFVPKHNLNGNISYSFKKIAAFYQHLYTSRIYTTTDNSPDYAVSAYTVANLGAFYKVLSSKKMQLELGLKINNVFNKAYQVMPSRPMPNRNFNLNINYKF